MFRVLSRVLVIAAAVMWLGGCSSTGSMFAKSDKPAGATESAETAVAESADGTEAMAADLPVQPAVVRTAAEPAVVSAAQASAFSFAKPLAQDDVSLGKKYYLARDYGLAEKHFRAAAESQPRNAEAWLGLAAAYDQLRRFDLADRAYAQVIKIAGETVEIINNQGYSYLLRGDYRRARARLLLADAKSPDNPYVQANLKLLAERSGRPVAGQ
jgi:Flp pilus assembly protein TadD